MKLREKSHLREVSKSREMSLAALAQDVIRRADRICLQAGLELSENRFTIPGADGISFEVQKFEFENRENIEVSATLDQKPYRLVFEPDGFHNANWYYLKHPEAYTQVIQDGSSFLISANIHIYDHHFVLELRVNQIEMSNEESTICQEIRVPTSFNLAFEETEG